MEDHKRRGFRAQALESKKQYVEEFEKICEFEKEIKKKREQMIRLFSSRKLPTFEEIILRDYRLDVKFGPISYID